MDITSLLALFTDANVPKSCTHLWIEMMRTHGNLSKDGPEIKSVIKYLDNALKKYKSDVTGPLMLLNYLVEDCSDSVFVENCMSWLDKLSKIIQVNCNVKIVSLACDVVINIISFVVQNSDLNRQFCNSVLSNLVTSLLDINEHKLCCLRKVMKTFPGPCRQFQIKIENLVMEIFLESTNQQLQREAAQCFLILPNLNLESDVGWNECFKKILATIHNILTELFETVERGDPIWKSDYTESLSFVAIPNAQPMLKFQSLYQRFNLLCYCISEMLSGVYSGIKQIPVRDVIGFVTRVLIITPFSIKSATTENLMLAGVLPLLHEYAFRVLHSLIIVCRKYLIPESSTISKLIIKGLKWTSRVQSETTSKKPFSDLRCQIYSTLTLENSSVENNRKKRKRGNTFSGVGSVGPIKEDPLVNNSICLNCLKALKAVHLAIGSTISSAVYLEITKFTIHLMCDVQKTISNRPTPYDDFKCRHALYDVILAFVLVAPQETGSCIQLCMKIFSCGRQDAYQKISSLCLQAQSTCLEIIHPRLPPLQFDMKCRKQVIHKSDEAEEQNGIDEEENIEMTEEFAQNGVEIRVEGNTEKTEGLEQNEQTTKGDIEMTEELKQNGLEKEETITHENKRSKIMSDSTESTAPIIANDDFQVVVTLESEVILPKDESEENSIADSDIEIVSSSLNSSPSKKPNPLENLTITPKALPIGVNESPVSPTKDEANLTVEEMLQDFVNDPIE
uniref:Pre-rRNA-processing protein RIX1 N-terminal domain-containing protein n=1 Tax=Strigamia maritima TaxID=126957 RepID=T1J4S9_STRMM